MLMMKAMTKMLLNIMISCSVSVWERARANVLVTVYGYLKNKKRCGCWFILFLFLVFIIAHADCLGCRLPIVVCPHTTLSLRISYSTSTKTTIPIFLFYLFCFPLLCLSVRPSVQLLLFNFVVPSTHQPKDGPIGTHQSRFTVGFS